VRKTVLIIVVLVLLLDVSVAFWDETRNYDGDGWRPSTPIAVFVFGYSRDEACHKQGFDNDEPGSWDCTGFDGELNALPWAWVQIERGSAFEKFLLAIPKWLEIIALIVAGFMLYATLPPPPPSPRRNAVARHVTRVR